MLQRRKSPAVLATMAALAALASFGGCARPTQNPATLAAIEQESRMLMRAYPRGGGVPEGRRPPTIAGLEPELVWVDAQGVWIMVEAYFDGGWGYFVARDARAAPQPEGRFRKLGGSVYWWHPY